MHIYSIAGHVSHNIVNTHIQYWSCRHLYIYKGGVVVNSSYGFTMTQFNYTVIQHCPRNQPPYNMMNTLTLATVSLC